MEIEKFQNETLWKLAGQERHTLRSQIRPPPTLPQIHVDVRRKFGWNMIFFFILQVNREYAVVCAKKLNLCGSQISFMYW